MDAPPIYEIFMIGKYGATWGKMGDENTSGAAGWRPHFLRTFPGRYFAKILSGIMSLYRFPDGVLGQGATRAP